MLLTVLAPVEISHVVMIPEVVPLTRVEEAKFDPLSSTDMSDILQNRQRVD